jgi:hypothetical protein
MLQFGNILFFCRSKYMCLYIAPQILHRLFRAVVNRDG